MSSMSMLSTGGGIPIRQTKLAPDGVEFSEDVSEARWVEESLSSFRDAACLDAQRVCGVRPNISPCLPD